MTTKLTQQTQAVWEHHLQAFGQGLDVLLSDYTEDSVIFTPNGPVCGLDAIRVFLEAFLKNLPAGMMGAMQILRQDVHEETAYIFALRT